MLPLLHLKAVFGDCTHVDGMMDMQDRCSRKKQFVPPLTAKLGGGFDILGIPDDPAPDDDTELVMGEDSNGFLLRVASNRGVV